MAGINQKTNSVQARNNFEVLYSGRWVVADGASAVTKTAGGVGMTLATTAEGLYTLTLDCTPAAITHVDAVRTSNVGQIVPLTITATGATFRTGVYASPQTAAHPVAGESIMIRVVALKSTVK